MEVSEIKIKTKEHQTDFMKLSLSLKLAALIIMGTASSLLATGVAQNFEFQWTTSDSGFSPTFLNITAILGVQIQASTAITGFEITTPNGVWTPTSFTPTGGTASGTPFWQSGASLTVSGTTAAPVLTFAGNGDILETPGGTFYEVNLQTTSITGSMFFAPNDASGTSTGSWNPVTQSASAPEAADTWMLLLAAVGGLAILHQSQRIGAGRNKQF